MSKQKIEESPNWSARRSQEGIDNERKRAAAYRRATTKLIAKYRAEFNKLYQTERDGG